ncbi:MAG: chromosome partitioning protein ParB [Caulobacteraceae bacterium]|nr:chromosome partitioning protein ParB [Caulobacteraceae bacterium]
MTAHEPLLKPQPLAELKPTQITVGFHEVEEKRKHFRELKEQDSGTFIGRHMIPTVLGPKKRHYIIDNHHLACALYKEGVESVLVTVTADLSVLSKASFWRFLDNRAWCHPYDTEGRRIDFDDIPGSITGLKDDPYRSLAGDLRHAGGYAKDLTPFSEFLWADFLRPRIKRKTIDKDYGAALNRAVRLAKSNDATFLPGWCGASPIA